MNANRYLVSFSTGGLFLENSLKLVALHCDLKNWTAVTSKVNSDNVLQYRTLSTSKRVCREVVSRLKMLTDQELQLLVDGVPQDQQYMLWIAICRRYQFIADFAVEILRENYLTLNTKLLHEDFDIFFDRKSELHPKLEKVSQTTRRKLRQVLFKILREAELLSNDDTINAALLSPPLLEAISFNRHQDLHIFPIFESDLRRIAS